MGGGSAPAVQREPISSTLYSKEFLFNFLPDYIPLIPKHEPSPVSRWFVSALTLLNLCVFF